ncbi:putative acetoacetate decarboxylase [Rickettsiales bacterium Ac37b]|nr:putative acetoacetate decarboxylase [Rickettsiales bacterium Ac37b]
MHKQEILNLASMPLDSPSYPKGPYRFIDREYLVITYESNPSTIAEALPEPLIPDGSNTVTYEFIKMPDSSGFGSYCESGLVIPALFNKEPVNFTAQMYLDCEPPIAAGREIWGFPKKHAKPKLYIIHDTLTGILEYGGEKVAIGTMGYKHENLIHKQNSAEDIKSIINKLSKTQVNLKLIPDVNGQMAIAQLVGYQMTELELKGAWRGPGRLHLVPHVNAPVADLPVKRIVDVTHFIVDATLPYGNVLFDYLKK